MKIYNILYVFFSIIIFGYIFSFGTCLSTSQESLGQIGDFFGGILNPIIGMVVLYFLIKSYQTQKEELEKTSLALSEQKNLMQIQNFENHFFKLLDKFTCILKETEYRGKLGKETFCEILNEEEIKEFSNILDKDTYITNYTNFYTSNLSFPHKYINFLLLIINFICQSEYIQEMDKQKYINILKTNLSTAELEFISFHFLIDDSYIAMSIKYKFFEYLDFGSRRINTRLCEVFKSEE